MRERVEMVQHPIMLRSTIVFLILLLALETSLASDATELPPPSGPVLLSVTGQIAHTNAPGRADLDFALLLALGPHKLATTTPWTDGTPVFRGVLIRDILAFLGASGEAVRATAHNDSRIEIPISDFLDYPVLLAYEMNGQRLSIRDKGPLWIIFPRDQFPEFRDHWTERKMIWQLMRLQVR